MDNNEFKDFGKKIGGNADFSFDEPKKAKDYFQPENGDNNIRILTTTSEMIQGYTFWKESVAEDGSTVKKPIRVKRDAFEEGSYSDKDYVDNITDKLKKPKFFWGVLIYNYKVKKVQFWEIRQASIRGQLKTLFTNPKYSNPTEYDLNVVKTGTSFENTEYNVVREDKEAMTNEVKNTWDKVKDKIDMSGLFNGIDLFAELNK